MKDERRDLALVERAVEQFVEAVADGRWVNADEAATIPIGMSTLATFPPSLDQAREDA